MKIAYAPTMCLIVETTRDEKLAADIALTVRHPKYRFMPAHRIGGWNGLIRFIKSRKFPSGLLGLLTTKLGKKGYQVEVVRREDKILPAKPASKDMLPGVELWDNQVQLIDRLVRERRGIADAITGSGKTMIMAGVIEALSRPRTIVLVSSLYLMEQTQEHLSAALPCRVGFIHGTQADLHATVLVTTVQTLIRRLQTSARIRQFLAEEVEIVMADECHEVPARIFSVAMENIHAPYRYGFSATPLNDNPVANMTLMGATGPVVGRIGFKEQIDAGRAAVPHIFFYSVGEAAALQELEYKDAYDEGVVYLEDKNQRIVESTLWFVENRVPTLILVEKLRHGRHLHELLRKAGIQVEYLHGNTPTDKQKRAVRRFERGHLPVIIATRIFRQGVDIKAIQGLILADEGVSPRKTLQQIGRGMRVAPGQLPVLYVVDFINRTSTYLLDHSIERLRTYRRTKAYVIHCKDEPLQLLS